MDPSTKRGDRNALLAVPLKRFENDLTLALAGYTQRASVERYDRRVPPYRETRAMS